MEKEIFRAKRFDPFREVLLKLFEKNFNNFFKSFSEISIANRKIAEDYVLSFEKVIWSQIENYIYYKLVATKPKIRQRISRIKEKIVDVNSYSKIILDYVNKTPELKAEFNKNLEEIIQDCFLIPNMMAKDLVYESKRERIKKLRKDRDKLIRNVRNDKIFLSYIETWELMNNEQITCYAASKIIKQKYSIKDEHHRRKCEKWLENHEEVLPMLYQVVIENGTIRVEKLYK